MHAPYKCGAICIFSQIRFEHLTLCDLCLLNLVKSGALRLYVDDTSDTDVELRHQYKVTENSQHRSVATFTCAKHSSEKK